MLAKYRFRLVKLASHVGLLRALTGEHEDHRRFSFVRLSGDHAFRVACGQGVHGVLDAVANDHPAVAKRFAADLQGERHIGQIEVGIFLQMFDQIGRHCFERGI